MTENMCWPWKECQEMWKKGREKL